MRNQSLFDLWDMVKQMAVGSRLTILLFFVTLLFSIPIGVGITYLYKNNNVLIKKSTAFYVLVIRGTPLILQIFFIYFGLPNLPYVGQYFVRMNGFVACSIAFVFNYAAYFAEIFRGGLLAVDRGQYEAAKVLGLTPFQTGYKIILPQVTRVVLPSISNEAIILVKDTALITILAQPELLHVTKTIVNRTANVFPFVIAAVFYLVMSYAVTVFFNKMEQVFSY